MVYDIDNMLLEPIHEVLHGKCNDVLVCSDIRSPIESKYTLWVIRDRQCTKILLDMFENMARESIDGEKPFIKQFAQGENMCFLFPYQAPRPIERFVYTQAERIQDKERICIELVMRCLSSVLPFPLICSMFEQGCVNIAQDGSIYFNYYLDLSKVNLKDDETVCTDLCVSEVIRLLRDHRKLKTMRLLNMKLEKSAYQSLTELYRDIKLTVLPEKKPSIRKRIAGVWQRNKDRWFRWLLVFCVVIVVLTLLVLLSQLIFGEVPLFRIFDHSMDVVGTERLDGR